MLSLLIFIVGVVLLMYFSSTIKQVAKYTTKGVKTAEPLVEELVQQEVNTRRIKASKLRAKQMEEISKIDVFYTNQTIEQMIKEKEL